MKYVDSTCILGLERHPDGQVLLIFTGGRSYKVEDLPEDLYQQWLASESKGRFFNHKIRPHYKIVKVPS